MRSCRFWRHRALVQKCSPTGEAGIRWVELNWLQDGELLGLIGRSRLRAVLAILAPFLAEQDIALPDVSLPDTLYFPALAATFRDHPMKLVAYVPPFIAAGSQGSALSVPLADDSAPPEPDQESRGIAAKVFELLTALDPDKRLRKAPPIKVFNLYYRQRLEPADIARICKCHRSLIFHRLAAIQAKLPWTPQQLRELSPQVEAMHDALTYSQAKDIHRKSAVYGDRGVDGESD